LIFVTGATGFIGQQLLNALESSPASFGNIQPSDIKILSRLPHQNYKTVICDLETELIPEDSLDSIDTVFHLAGFSHDIRDATEVEQLYRAINVDATERLTELAVASGVKRFVFVSSVKAGGNSVEEKPEGVYGQTKHEAELKILEISRLSGMHVSIVRPSLVYGPGVKGNLALMRRGIESGWFPPLPETGNLRSMVHVDDLVRALLLVADNKRANRNIFIATDGVPHSSREIYDAICHAVGKKVPQWSVPKIVFEGLSLLSPGISYKIDKLLGDEFYSSEKLERLGFKAECTLRDMDETIF
jgi:UDP-glucose 4-epimerase